MKIVEFVLLSAFASLCICSTYAAEVVPQKRLVQKIRALENNETVRFRISDFANAGIEGVKSDNLSAVVSKMKKIATTKNNETKRRDYRYDFNRSKAIRCPVEIVGGEFLLSCTSIPKNATAFLKIGLKSTLLGGYFPPSVTFYDELGNKTVHTFEAATNGIRYANLSSLRLSSYEKIRIVSKRIIVPDQNATLYLFNPPKLEGKRILIVAPHPDDAEIAAFGLYSTYAKESYIVTVTAGEAGADEIYTELTRDKDAAHILKGRHRAMDSIAVPMYGKVSPEHTIQLGYFDTRLSWMYRNMDASVTGRYKGEEKTEIFRRYNRSSIAKHLIRGNDWHSLVENLEYLIGTIRPDIIVTPYPPIDKHPDHRFSTVALLQALRHMHYKRGKLFFYTNHCVEDAYYPFGKRGEAMSLPPFYGGNLYFDTLFSFPLSREVQTKKLLALDMMSDIRYSMIESVKSDIALNISEKDIVDPCQGNNSLICKDFTYFRKGVRQNELFYVVDTEKIYDDSIDLEKGYAVRYAKRLDADSVPKRLPICKRVRMHTDRFALTRHTMYLEGWAFVAGWDGADTNTYLLLHSRERKYLYLLFKKNRKDVAKLFGFDGYEKSGFYGVVDTDDLPVGEYGVALVLKNDKKGVCKIPLKKRFIRSSRVRDVDWVYYRHTVNRDNKNYRD